MKRLREFVSVLAVALVATISHAEWVPDYQIYSIQRIGLWGAAQTSSSGLQTSYISSHLPGGFTVGYSSRYSGDNTGQNTWVFNPIADATMQTGLTGTEHTGASGFQFSINDFTSIGGIVAGHSGRYVVGPFPGTQTFNGNNTWVYDPVANATYQTGLTGTAYTGMSGYQESSNTHQNSVGQVAGHSIPIRGTNSYNGQAAWSYDPATNSTFQIGLTGPEYVGSTGYQFSEIRFLNDSGQLAGVSRPVVGNVGIGQSAWAVRHASQPAVQIGLTDAQYTGSLGFRYSDVVGQSQGGLIIGYSRLIAGTNTFTGQRSWIYDPVANGTTELGLSGPAQPNGEYTSSYATLIDEAGHVAGSSARSAGGTNVWIYDSGTGSTLRIGLTETDHIGINGYQFTFISLMNAEGQVAGHSQRIRDVSSDNGRDTWVFLPSSQVTVQTGLTGPEYTGSAGFRSSNNSRQNSTGFVAGHSNRITGVNTDHGDDTWVYSPSMHTTVRTGLSSAEHTGANGFQMSGNSFLNSSGQVAGFTRRQPSTRIANNGSSTWIYDPVSNTTVQTGLDGPEYTGSEGYEYSENLLQNDAGHVVGVSWRISGINTFFGQAAWYFDPVTGVTSAVIGEVRSADGFASTTPRVLTDDGFLLGYYSTFDAGGAGSPRAFAFRPDLGLIDLGELVDPDLSFHGWSSLREAQFSDSLNSIVGRGLVPGQSSSRSAFIMYVSDEPHCSTCSADYNHNGGIEAGDLAAFFEDVDAGTACADIDRDGDITSNDVAAFFMRYEAGGC